MDGLEWSEKWIKKVKIKIKNTCYDEIGLCYQNIDNIMGSMVDTLHLEGCVCLLERGNLKKKYFDLL
jgi:hypothetical protein